MKKFLFLVLLISLVSFSPLHAASNNDEAPVTMEEVVVTATRDTRKPARFRQTLPSLLPKKSVSPAPQQ